MPYRVYREYFFLRYISVGPFVPTDMFLFYYKVSTAPMSESFLLSFFQKARGVKGQSPKTRSAERETRRTITLSTAPKIESFLLSFFSKKRAFS